MDTTYSLLLIYRKKGNIKKDRLVPHEAVFLLLPATANLAGRGDAVVANPVSYCNHCRYYHYHYLCHYPAGREDKEGRRRDCREAAYFCCGSGRKTGLSP